MLENKWGLVVEDDAHTLVAMTSLLRDLGIRFKRNTTGANVAEQVQSMTPPPDFILLDIDLSNSDAFAINRHIQSDTTGIPVIAVSSSPDFALRQRAQREGFAGFIGKPLPRRQFGDLLKRVLHGDPGWEPAT